MDRLAARRHGAHPCVPSINFRAMGTGGVLRPAIQRHLLHLVPFLVMALGFSDPHVLSRKFLLECKPVHCPSLLLVSAGFGAALPPSSFN